MMSDVPVPATFGLILAGGLARRMGGGDKAKIEIGGVSILDRVLATLSGQCDEALAAGAADQRQVGLARQLDAPRGEA